MNMKRLIKASMLLMVVALFAACANEDVAQDKKKENETEVPKGGVIFAANGPKVSAKRLSIDGEDEFAGAKTRTEIKHTPGNGADAYWESDDFIWVQKHDGTWVKSTGTTLHDGGTSAEFTLPGSMADYDDGCEVRYTTSTGYGISQPNYGAVVINGAQSRTTPNDFSHAGKWGDCGSAKAHATGNPVKFNFTLKHKASYLCFLPRCTNAALAPNIRLKGIVIKSIKNYYDPTSFMGDYCGFDGENISSTGGSPFGGIAIDVDLPEFPLSTTANQAANATYLVVRPGTYDFQIDYLIKNTATNIEGKITRDLANVTLDKGKIYDITADLTPIVAGTKYYAWGATQDYWHGYESSQPFINQGEPGATQGISSNPDPATKPEGGHEAFEQYFNHQTTAAPFKVAPTLNELYWYVMKGDPQWDGEQLWTLGGRMYKGGVWLRKKKTIVAYLKEKEGFPSTFTEADLKLGYKASATAPLDDRRIAGWGVWLTSYPKGSPNYLDDYFFLPASGCYFGGWLQNAGTDGWYWSDNTAQNHQFTACANALWFTKDKIAVTPEVRAVPCRVQAFE